MARRRKRKTKASERLEKMAAVTSKFDNWKPAREVLTKVIAQPTIFPQFDRATRCGGWPLQRFGVIHGPSNHGKTAFMLGLGLSFLRAGHFFAYVDAEFTTPDDWLQKLMSDYHDDPGFVAMRPGSYDETVEGVREFVEKLTIARAEGDIDANTSAFIGIDSLNKLVPEKLLNKLMKGEGGFDGADGRAGQMIAAINNQWLKELTPRLYHSGTALAVIAREYDRQKKSVFDQGPEFVVGGGRGVEFESSMTCRISRAGYVKKGKGRDAQVLGEKHKVTIRKTKVGGKEDKQEVAYFYTSNGVLIPEGFDRGRAVLEEAIKQGVVARKGSTYEWSSMGQVLGRGEHNVVKYLSDDEETMIGIEQEVRDRFAENAA